MEKLAKQLLQKLGKLEGSGQFATTDTVKFKYPSLHVEGVGELGFPLNPVQVKALIGVASKAPFGKGSQTVTDPSVRSAWEIDASQLRLDGEAWLATMSKILKKAAKALGLKAKDILADPYKMLVYEPGDFFLPHKDSEKAKGMFGTLVVGLPCDHEGGELLIRFGGKEVVADFSTLKGAARIPFAAFFADCEHEIRPLQAGYRVCLTFNLIQEGVAQPLSLAKVEAEVGALAAILEEMKPHFGHSPKVLLLQHEYTPANFSPGRLKGNDGPRAQALAAAAERAGYFSRLALATHYQLGDLEISRPSRRGRRGYYYDDYDVDPDDGEMGEVHEEYTRVEHWGELPGLGAFAIDDEDVLNDKPLGEGKPSEKAAEGYTGNAGMTLEYWYHYGAMVLWPKQQHGEILATVPLDVQLTWLAHYTTGWRKRPAEERQYAREILGAALDRAPAPEEETVYHYGPSFLDSMHISRAGTETTFVYDKEDYSPVALGLIHLGDADWVAAQADKLKNVAPLIDAPSWAALLVRYGAAPFVPVLQSLMEVQSEGNIAHLLRVLAALDTEQHPALRQLAVELAAEMPACVPRSKFTDSKQADETLNGLLTLSRLMPEDWSHTMAGILTLDAPRSYVNKHIVPAVQQSTHRGTLLHALLRQFCLDDLARRTAQMPGPPTDWTRPVPPQVAKERGVWEILRPFMASPVASAYDYSAKEADRREMERIVRAARLDLDMETISRGRPYTLRLKKNMASYQRRLSDWKEDVALLEQMG